MSLTPHKFVCKEPTVNMASRRSRGSSIRNLDTTYHHSMSAPATLTPTNSLLYSNITPRSKSSSSITCISTLSIPSMSWKVPLFIISFLHALTNHQTVGGTTSYLFSAESRGGIVSLAVDTNRAGQTTELANNSLVNLGRYIGELSYDVHNSYVLAREVRPEQVVLAPVCSDPTSPAALIFNTSSTFPIINTHYRGSTTDCMECHAGPFALFDNKIYFLLTGEFGLAPLTRAVAQLRVLQTCEDCQLDLRTIMDTGKSFKTPYLFNCSRVVAEVFSQSIAMQGHVHLKAGRSIKVVKSEQGLHFFFQLFTGKKQRRQRAYSDLLLYQVTDDGLVTMMHSEKVDSQYAQWNIHALASVDYKEDLLCWSAADRLYCGQLGAPTWTLHNVHRLLYPGEGAALGICHGHPPDLLVYISGVAIAEEMDKWNHRVIFFGCYPQWKGLGGTGMIKVDMSGGDEKLVFAITRQDGRTPIFSGSMFSLPAPPGPCRPPGRIDICLEPPVWLNKPGSTILKDKPDDNRQDKTASDSDSDKQTNTTTTPQPAVYKTESIAEPQEPQEQQEPQEPHEQVEEDLEVEEELAVEVKMQESKMNPDPEIIVVDNVQSIDEFDRDKSTGHVNAHRNIYLEIITIIMLFANMFVPLDQ